MLPRRLFCDTSFFYACLASSDVNHLRASRLIEEAEASRSSFLTTWDIVSETTTLLRYRHSFDAAWTFLSEVKPTLRLVRYEDGARAEAEEIFHIYGKDHRLSFCDAVSYVVVTTLLDDMPCLAFDRDFCGLGLTVLG